MIAVIEPVCSDWVHENVNAGILQLLSECCNGIHFFSEKQQSIAVQMLLGEKKNELFFHDIAIPKDSFSEKKQLVSDYWKILSRIVIKNNLKFIIITTAYTPMIIAVNQIAKQHKRKKFIICLHAMMDHHTEIYVDIIKKTEKNILYVTYSYNCYIELQDRGVTNVIFLHHPYVKNIILEHNKTYSNRIRIGIVGQSANDNALRIVDACEKHEELHNKIVFHLASNCKKTTGGMREYLKYKNVEMISNQLSTVEREKMLNKLDCILLPYGRKSYKLSASGVFWDAISRNIPYLSYDNKYILYYDAIFNNGLVAFDFNEMITNINRMVRNCEIKNNEEILKEIHLYNVNTMKKLLEK